MLDALTYPIRNGGWVMILLRAIFSVILDLLKFAPVFGIPVAIFGAGWFLAAAVAMYSLMFQARFIGLIYREKRDLLDWD